MSAGPSARHALERALVISPDSGFALTGMITRELVEGHPERAAPLADRITQPMYHLLMTALIQHSLGHAGQSQRALDELVACCAASGAYQVAEVYAWRGEPERAFGWLERAVRQRDSGLSSLVNDPFFESLRRDPRYRALLAKLRLAD